jgi:lipooligosaccharide transport system permease protein
VTRQPPDPLGPVAAPWRLLHRNYLAYRRGWIFFLTGFLEPVLYLFSIGVGVGQLIGAFELNGRTIPYAAFVAPGMLAASAMNGAVLDSTFNVFFKLKYAKLYDAVLATPMSATDVARGEIGWALMRGGLYSTGFLLVMLAMGLVGSWWAVLAVPAALLVGFAFAAVGMALTTWIRSWQDFEYVQLAIMPMFLFSATFFPVTTFHGVLRWVVEVTPLYRGVVLCRELVTGAVSMDAVWSVLYLAVMGVIGLAVVSRRPWLHTYAVPALRAGASAGRGCARACFPPFPPPLPRASAKDPTSGAGATAG